MYGAILGDIIGSPYEFDQGDKLKEFPLFIDRSQFTDDTVMTIAVAEALMDSMNENADTVRRSIVNSMMKWGHRYPDAGYGGHFAMWLFLDSDRDIQPPYNSFGNGSAMRVSSAGWLFDTLEDTLCAARLSAEVTHNHPEGIKGAESVAGAIFLARNGSSKAEIKDFIVTNFEYDL